MRCDTCHREVPEVSRVVIYVGYNKAAAKAVYNCPDCFAQKERSKAYNQPASPSTKRRSADADDSASK